MRIGKPPGLQRAAAVRQLYWSAPAQPIRWGLAPTLRRSALRYCPKTFGFSARRLPRIVFDQPRLERWLHFVFVVLGGQMAALGLLLAAFAIRLASPMSMDWREPIALGLTGTISVALMSAVNFALGSNFRWLLVIPVLSWSLAVGLAALVARTAPAEVGEHVDGR